MHKIIYLLATVQVLFMIVLSINTAMNSSTMDAAGRGMAQGLLVVGWGLMVIFLFPAVLLARSSRFGWIAMLLVLVFPVLGLLSMGA